MIKLTLDTNCIINLLDFKSKTPTSVDELSEIVKYAMDGNVNIAITTRVEFDFDGDSDTERKTEMIRKICMFPIIGTMARFNVSKFGSGDFFAGEEHIKLKDELRAILFPGLEEKSAHYKNKIADIDHLIGHYVHKRDIFVTDDKGVLRRAGQLKKSFGVIVMNPAQCLEYLDSHASKEVLAQQVLDKVKALHNLISRTIESEYAEKMDTEYTELREWLLKKYPKFMRALCYLAFK